MTIDDPIRGKVARIINNRELVINRGTEHGVEKGMFFAVLDKNLDDIVDPETGDILGSLERPRVFVKASDVHEKFSIARTFRSRMTGSVGLTGVASLFEPRKRVYDTLETDEQTWQDLDEADSFVKTGDPVKQVEDPDGK